MYKSLAIANKNLKLIYRNLKTWAIVFVLPVAFMGIFALVFNQQPGEIRYKLAYAQNSDPQFQTFLQNLDQLRTSKQELRFIVQEYADEAQVLGSVRNRTATVGLIWQNDRVKLLGDTMDQSSAAAIAILSQYGQNFFGQSTERVIIAPVALKANQNASGFEYLVPGLIVYGMLSLLPQVALNLSVEAQQRKTFRYFTARASGWHIIGGYLISQSVIALIQTSILFGTALLLGYHTSAGNLLNAWIIALPTNLSVVGLGLVLGSLFKNSAAASNLGSMASIILGFLSGAFVVFPDIRVWGDITITQLVPTYHATEAMRQILQYDASLSAVASQLWIVGLSSLLLMVLGTLLYDRLQLRKII